MRAVAAGAALVLATTVLVGFAPAKAEAISGNDFNPGLIISDAVFYNYSSMSAGDIQTFLQTRVTNCTAGYTCLKDYVQDTPAFGGDQYCSGLNGGRDSAAQIIWEVAQSCRISPKVLLVLLEKEQSLVSSRSPSTGRYNSATGYSCPDTAPCDPSYFGFVYQVYYAARAFNRYAANPGSFGYRAGQTHNILYHPNRDCGTKSVYVQNQATANLYIYTPYTPNGAALGNLYGTGDGCSSYGNRNFWRIFSDWFGSTLSNTSYNQSVSLTYALYADVLDREPDPSGLSTWPGYLLYSGWSPPQVANAILYSDEYFMKRIVEAYSNVLGRGPDPVGQADWLSRMQRRTANVDDIASEFTRSDEYFAQSGSDPAEFVRRLYLTMLGREASTDEVTFWADVVARNGTHGAAAAIYGSYESGVIRVNRIYQTYLKRDADPDGISSWVPLVLAKGDQAVRSALVSSLEYYLAAQSRFPQPD